MRKPSAKPNTTMMQCLNCYAEVKIETMRMWSRQDVFRSIAVTCKICGHLAYPKATSKRDKYKVRQMRIVLREHQASLYKAGTIWQIPAERIDV